MWIESGTAFAIAFPRRSMVMAHATRDLQKAFGGRMRLGIGSQIKGLADQRSLFIPTDTAPGPLGEVTQDIQRIPTKFG